jgi:hypothetical protein
MEYLRSSDSETTPTLEGGRRNHSSPPHPRSIAISSTSSTSFECRTRILTDAVHVICWRCRPYGPRSWTPRPDEHRASVLNEKRRRQHQQHQRRPAWLESNNEPQLSFLATLGLDHIHILVVDLFVLDDKLCHAGTTTINGTAERGHGSRDKQYH